MPCPTSRRRKRFTIIATILGSTIVFLDATVVNVALPAISDDLNAGLADQQWVVEAYALATVSLLLVGGRSATSSGAAGSSASALIGFGITSILCAIAPSSPFLIGARALQGLTGALLVPGSLAILAATFEGAERGKAGGHLDGLDRDRDRDRAGGRRGCLSRRSPGARSSG